MLEIGIVTMGGDPIEFDALRRVWVEAERLGMDQIWLYDHVTCELPMIRYIGQLEAWTTMGVLAGSTSKIRFGPLITPIRRRHPALLAKMSSTLDYASGGRLTLAMGTGGQGTFPLSMIGFSGFEKGIVYDPTTKAYIEKFADKSALEQAATDIVTQLEDMNAYGYNEWSEYGYPLLETPEKIERLREEVEIIRRMWTEDKVTFKGKYYTINNAMNYPKPVQKPHPPLILGTFLGRKVMPRLAAEVADGVCLCNTDNQYCKDFLETYDRHCRELGRNPDDMMKARLLYVTVAEDETDERALLEHTAKSFGFSVNTFVAMYRLAIAGGIVIGTPEKCAEGLKKLICDVGCNHVAAAILGAGGRYGKPDLDRLRLFAKEVVPTLKDYAQDT